MALAMMQSVRENASSSVDRYVIFTDRASRKVPNWIELIHLGQSISNDKFHNWSLKPKLFNHPAVAEDTLLFIDADTTIYRDVLQKAFDWIEENSLLLWINFVPDSEPWGPYNLREIYLQAGYNLTNLVINSGIVGRKPDALGLRFQNLWNKHMDQLSLERYFNSASYKLADEPYAGLAHQLAYLELGIPLPVQNHPFTFSDYIFTVGANPKKFYATPGPVIEVPWYSESVVNPAIVHWVENTQYFFYRSTLWYYMLKTGLLPRYLPSMLLEESAVMRKRLLLKLHSIRGGKSNATS